MSREFLFTYALTPTQTPNEFTINANTGLNPSNVTDTPDSAGDNTDILGDIANDAFTAGTTSEVYEGYGVAVFNNGSVAVAGPIGLNQQNFTLYSEQSIAPGTVIQLQPDMPGPTGANQFSLTTAAPVACYCSGTLIRAMRGRAATDVAVEALQIGDVAVTASGALRPIKWIGHRAYAGRFANANPDTLPICFKAGSLADNVPVRDLWVSPKHAMFLDGALFPAEVLVNGVSIVKAERVDSVTYWHVELDSHDVLIAEGAASESFVDDNTRGMFHNAHTFAQMYPGAAKPAVYCAPRIEDGHQLESVRRLLAARAGIVSEPPDCGTLNGYIDAMDGNVVRGWVRSSLNPAMPVCLELVVDGQVVAEVLANRRRADLEAAGYGPHAFEIALPADVHGKRVEVRRSADGARLKTVLDRAA